MDKSTLNIGKMLSDKVDTLKDLLPRVKIPDNLSRHKGSPVDNNQNNSAHGDNPAELKNFIRIYNNLKERACRVYCEYEEEIVPVKIVHDSFNGQTGLLFILLSMCDFAEHELYDFDDIVTLRTHYFETWVKSLRWKTDETKSKISEHQKKDYKKIFSEKYSLPDSVNLSIIQLKNIIDDLSKTISDYESYIRTYRKTEKDNGYLRVLESIDKTILTEERYAFFKTETDLQKYAQAVAQTAMIIRTILK